MGFSKHLHQKKEHHDIDRRKHYAEKQQHRDIKKREREANQQQQQHSEAEQQALQLGKQERQREQRQDSPYGMLEIALDKEHYGFRRRASLTDERPSRFVNGGGRVPPQDPLKAQEAFKAVGGPPVGPKESLRYDLN